MRTLFIISIMLITANANAEKSSWHCAINGVTDGFRQEPATCVVTKSISNSIEKIVTNCISNGLINTEITTYAASSPDFDVLSKVKSDGGIIEATHSLYAKQVGLKSASSSLILNTNTLNISGNSAGPFGNFVFKGKCF